MMKFQEDLMAFERKYWTVLPLGGGRAFVQDSRKSLLEDAERPVLTCAGECSVADLKNAIRNLPPDIGLENVSVIITSDHEECGGRELLSWLLRIRREKEFNIATLVFDGDVAARQMHAQLLGAPQTMRKAVHHE